MRPSTRVRESEGHLQYFDLESALRPLFAVYDRDGNQFFARIDIQGRAVPKTTHLMRWRRLGLPGIVRLIGREDHTHLRPGIAVVVKVKDNPGRDGLRLVRWRNLPPGTGSLSHQQLLLGHRSSSFLHSRR